MVGRPPALAVEVDLALTRLPSGDELAVQSKQEKQLTAPTVCQYWSVVRAAARVDRSTTCTAGRSTGPCSRLFKLGLSKRAIAAQMGWSEKAVDALLRTYGHVDVVALEKVDALYESERGVPAPAE